jgi:hypothetical protein
MPTNHPERALAASAHELQRAARHLQKPAAAADQVPALGITLAHVEEALDRLTVGMMQMANGVVEWSAEHGRSADEDVLPPEARALCFHLRAAADALRAPRDACTSSRIWMRRLVAAYSDTAQGSELCLNAPHPTRGSSRQTPDDTSIPSPLRS